MYARNEMVTYIDMFGNHSRIPLDLQEDLVNLEMRYVSRIERLELYPALRSLTLHSKIERIEGLEHCTELRVLDLRGNRIRRIEGLERLTKLEELYLDNNQIERIEGLDALSRLRVLSLSGNGLRRIDGIEHLEHLEVLNVSYNQIARCPPLVYPQLRQLELIGNPLVAPPELASLRNLRRLSYDAEKTVRLVRCPRFLRELSLPLDRLDATPEELRSLLSNHLTRFCHETQRCRFRGFPESVAETFQPAVLEVALRVNAQGN